MTDAILTPYRNPGARAWRTSRLEDLTAFHRSLPGYAPTRLVDLPELAGELRVGRVLVKEESSRLGLPAFKILGAAYAVSRALATRWRLPGTPSLPALAEASGADRVELVAATDGNHGRAVAHMARLVGLPARIFFPADLSPAAKEAIRSEGATAVELPLPYDDVVSAARSFAESQDDAAVLVQDTAWPGYDAVPQWIVDGYSTMFTEIDRQLADLDISAVDLVVVPVGVGSLAQAAVRHYRSTDAAPRVLSVEPDRAPAIIASLHAGQPVTVATEATVMAGLNCGTVSENAWPLLHAGLDLATTVSDDDAATAVYDLERLGVDAGPCGAATLAGSRALVATEPLPADAVVLLLSTEGRAANPLPVGR